MVPELYISRDQRPQEEFQAYLEDARRYKESDRAAVFIVGVNGGRPEGNTRNSLRVVLNRIESYNYRTLMINLNQTRMSFDDDAYSNDPESCKYPVDSDDDVPNFHELLLLSDGIVFGCPTKWADGGPRTHLFLNHLTPLENSGFMLEGKASSVVVAGEESGQVSVLENMLWVTNNMGFNIPPYGGSAYTITGRPGKGKEPKIKPSWAKGELMLYGDNLIKRILVDRFSGIDWDRRRSKEQIERLQALLRTVTFERDRLIAHLSDGSNIDIKLRNGEDEARKAN